MRRQLLQIVPDNIEISSSVTLKWSEILEGAFDYYSSDYLPAWTLNTTKLNKIGEKIFIWKKNKQWVSWENICAEALPDIATLFDLLPDLPQDEDYWNIIDELIKSGIRNSGDHFWENIFSYKQANEIFINNKIYRITWVA